MVFGALEQNEQAYRDYEKVINSCREIRSDKQGNVVFRVYSEKDTDPVNEILDKWQIRSIKSFAVFSKEHHQRYMAEQANRMQTVTHILTTVQNADNVSVEKIAEAMACVFPANQPQKEFLLICRQYTSQIEACLRQIVFPNSFWEAEETGARRYADRISRETEIVNILKQWSHVSLVEKEYATEKAADIFNQCYGTDINVVFFRPESQADVGASGEAWGAYYRQGKIYMNEERLQNDPDFSAVSVLFHEGTHWRQNKHLKDFKAWPAVYRILACHLENLSYYRVGGKSVFYDKLPSESHAYRLQDCVERRLAETIGLTPPQKSDIHRSALAWAMGNANNRKPMAAGTNANKTIFNSIYQQNIR